MEDQKQSVIQKKEEEGEGENTTQEYHDVIMMSTFGKGSSNILMPFFMERFFYVCVDEEETFF